MNKTKLFAAALAAALTFASGPLSAGFLTDKLQAAQSQDPIELVVTLPSRTDIRKVLRRLDGVLLDEIPGTNSYLVSVPSLPLGVGLLPGVDLNRPVSLPVSLEIGVLGATGTAASDWYLAQPAFDVVSVAESHDLATGAGIVVADIDARFETDHPSLRDHLIPGYDFVAERTGSEDGALNQSSASFMFEDDKGGLFQSSSSFMFEDDGGLFQSSASFMFEDDSWLNQSSASFLFEDGGWLDQSSASFLFEGNGVALLADSAVRVLNPASAGESHGTFTAGIIAAMAPSASIMPIRAFDDDGTSDVFTLAKAIVYAVDAGAHVINMSWGVAGDVDVLRSAVTYAYDRGVILIASAGNMDSRQRYYPAAYPEVMAVAATDDLDRKAAFSNYGRYISVSAPGVNIISSYPGGGWGIKSGTSFSAPMVAAQAALLLSLDRGDAERLIEKTANDIDRKNKRYRKNLGSGRINVYRSVRRGQ